MVSTCPICGGQQVAILEEVDSLSVEESYESLFGSAPQQVREMPAATLIRCSSCDIEWFEPVAAGGGEYYAWIAQHELYPAHRWDFDFSLKAIGAPSTIVDVGAGSGTFALLAQQAGHHVACVESSPAAREILLSKGLEVFNSLGAAVESVRKPRVVTAFHVLEHVVDPLDFIKSLRDSSSEKVIVSVPHKGRIRFVYEPLDLPPHHLTRWSPQSLKTVLERSGLDRVELVSEPPARIDRAIYLLKRIESTLRIGGALSGPVSSRWGKCVSTVHLSKSPPGFGLLAVASVVGRSPDGR